MEIVQKVIGLVREHWVAIIAIYLAVHKLAVTVRDILDKTPETDDNIFEKVVTLMGKLGEYLLKAKRPS